MKTLSSALLLAFSLAGSACAQTLARDPASGNYRLTFGSYTVTIESLDRVAPKLALAVAPAGAALAYTYTLHHQQVPTARTPIVSLDVPCGGVESVAAPLEWNGWLREDASLCSFMYRRSWLEPGQTVTGLAVRSAHLPGIVEARVMGDAETPAWPTEDVPEAVYKLAETVNGRDGGWFRLKAVGPVRDRSSLGSPATGIAWLLSDLREACDAGWISARGVCASLREKLDNARKSLDRVNRPAARGHLDAFLQELEAQRGKHVDDNAYTLLKVIAEETRRRL